MDVFDAYFHKLTDIMQTIMRTQRAAMERAASALADAFLAGGRLYAFGCSHAGLLADELCYRTGGMAVVNSVHAPGLHLDVRPLSMSSQMERIPGYGATIARSLALKPGDAVIVHSVSGRNAVSVEFAQAARAAGATVIALTNVAYSSAAPSRLASGLRLMDVCDVLLDNCGEIGDSCLSIDSVPEKTAPTSTVAGAAILNAVAARAIERIAQAGVEPPVFLSANLDGGDAHNKDMMTRYHDRILYE